MTLLRFLIGNRYAILRIAGDRYAPWIGFVFVLSAGFAREYDGEDLLAEPWHLLLPLGASLVASLVLYDFVRNASRSVDALPALYWPDYASFLGLFWMTAPLAWLYAIPYERFLTYEAATDANVYTLGIVAAWRVALMIRVISVCADLSLRGAIGLVWLFGILAAFVALIANWVTNIQVFGLMGGLRSGEEGFHRAHQWAQFFNGLFCFALLPSLLLAGWLCGDRRGEKGWLVRQEAGPRPTLPVLGLAALSLVVWVPILPLTQPEQQRRRVVERALREGDYQAAARTLADHPRETFPPHWRPPFNSFKAFARFRDVHQTLGMLVALHEQSGPDWASAVYSRRLLLLIEGKPRGRVDELAILADALPRFPEGRALLDEARELKESGKKDDDGSGGGAGGDRARNRRENLRAILEAVNGQGRD